MNIQSIWAGEYYAYQHYKGNNTFPMHARKGKCIRVEKKPPAFGEKRAKAVVIFEVTRDNGEVYQDTVRARDVIDFWTQYEAERNAILAEREEKERIAQEQRERLRKEREEAIRLENEAREARARAEAERTTKLVDALVNKTGMPREAIGSVGPTIVSLDRTTLEFWLSIPNGGN